MGLIPDYLPNSLELQEAIKQLSTYSTEELLTLAKELSEKTGPIFGHDEIVTAIVAILERRSAIELN